MQVRLSADKRNDLILQFFLCCKDPHLLIITGAHKICARIVHLQDSFRFIQTDPKSKQLQKTSLTSYNIIEAIRIPLCEQNSSPFARSSLHRA